MTDEQIAEWTTRNDIMLGPDGIDSRRMYPESVIPTAEVTAKLREMRDAHSELLAAAKALLGLCEDYDIPMMADEPVEYRHLTRDAMNHLQAAIERAEATQPEPITQEALRQQEPVAIRELYVNADGTLRIETADRWDMRYAYTVVRLLTGKEARHE